MAVKLMDIETFRKMRDYLYNLTGFDFSLYDDTGCQLIPPASNDPIIDAFASSGIGRQEHETYLKGAIEKAVLRKSSSIFKGPMNQYHYFNPIRAGNVVLVLVGNAFYVSIKDFEGFLILKGFSYGLSDEDMKIWTKKIIFSDINKVSETCENIQMLFNLIVRESYEKNINMTRYIRAMTILELFSGIEQDITEEKAYSLLTDAIIFLFGEDTVSVMSPNGDKLIAVLTKGRLKKQVESVPLRYDSPIISDAVKKHMPVIFLETGDLLRLGYSDDIKSLHLFPLSIKDKTFCLLGVFNSRFSQEDVNTISKLCGFAAFLLSIIVSQKVVDKHINSLTSASLALNQNLIFQDPDALYESIVEVSSKLLNTERASLMLPEEERNGLHIKAVKGINKWIAKSIKIKVGDGIAGGVYKEGRPLIVSDIERNLSTLRKPNYKTGSFVSMPLKIGDEIIGVLNLADKISGEVFSEEDMMFLRYFASYASVAIKGAEYYRRSEEMRTLSITDSLTGLFNRRYFDERIFEELQRGMRYSSEFSLAIFDIDDFKLFNDSEGHIAGDEVLKTIANVSRESLREVDIIARFGGEEFSIIMPQTDKNEAFLVAERVRKSIRSMMHRTWEIFPRERITVSIGIATFPGDGEDAKTLIKNADRALYKAKVSGKDKAVIWKSSDPSDEKPFHDGNIAKL